MDVFLDPHNPAPDDPTFFYILPSEMLKERMIGLSDRFIELAYARISKIKPLIPMLIDVELDAVHAIQPCCAGMDLAHLKRAYGSKIVFNGYVDSHHVLIGSRRVLQDTEKGRAHRFF